MSLNRKDSVSLYRFRKALQELDAKEGRGTELVTLYVPPSKQMSDVMNYLRREHATAANIKSKATRKNVQDAIERVIQRLKLFKAPPANGLVLFSGAIPQNGPGSEKIEVHSIIPPEPIRVFSYKCDSKFNTDPLKEMFVERDIFGIIVIDNEEAAIAVARGRTLSIMKTFTSGVPGKHRAGGQSAKRFERLREAGLNEYYKRIGQHANEIFLRHPEMKGIILAGPGPTKETFAKRDLLHYSLRDKIHIVDAAYSGESGVRETIDRGRDVLAELRYVKEKELVQDFLKAVANESGLATYGLEEVRESLKRRAVDTLLISEGLDLQELTIECGSCGHKRKETVDKVDLLKRESEVANEKCPSCRNQTLKTTDRKPLIDALIDEAEASNASVELISNRTEEGEMLREAFGGVAALLKH